MKRQRIPRTRREKADYAAPLVEMAYRSKTTLEVCTGAMRRDGIKVLFACGCRTGVFGKVRCATHDKAHRLREERRSKHRACDCKMLDQLCEQTATAIRVGQYELADKLRRMRASHVCPGERPKDEESAVFRFWLKAYRDEEKRLDLMYFGERKPSRFKGDPWAGLGR